MNNLSPNKQQHSKLKTDSGKLCSESLQSWLPAANSNYRVECLLPTQPTELSACCQLNLQSWVLAASSTYRVECLLPAQPTELSACWQLNLQSWVLAASSNYRVDCLLAAQTTELIACWQLKLQSWLLAGSSNYSWLLAGSSNYSWLLAASSNYRVDCLLAAQTTVDCLLPAQTTELIACCQPLNWVHVSENRVDELVITNSHECDYFRTKFEHKDYAFGGDSNSTFFVYVHAFKTPFWLQVSSVRSGRGDVSSGAVEEGWWGWVGSGGEIACSLLLPSAQDHMKNLKQTEAQPRALVQNQRSGEFVSTWQLSHDSCHTHTATVTQSCLRTSGGVYALHI